MHSDSLLIPTLALLDIDFRMLIAIVIPLAGIILGGVITVSAMYFHNRRREMWHQTARLALEKGQPLPPQADEAPAAQGPRSHRSNDFRSGLILIAVGGGLYLFLNSVGAEGARFVGAIPGFIGVALLLYGLFEAVFKRKHSGPDDRPTQP